MIRALAHRVVWRLGLQGALFRLREWRLAAFGARRADADGPPVPPPLLRVQVCGTADLGYFLESGRETLAEFDTLLRASGPGLAEAGAVLDLGCGCGRLARWFPGNPGRLTGMDIDARMVRWCAAQLPGTWSAVRLGEPLPAGPASFDLIYACSVITHLRRPTAQGWLAELARVLKPGGRALISFHDERHPSAAPVADDLARHGYAVRFDRLEGSNHLAAYATLEALTDLAAPGLRRLDARPSDATVCGQAIAVFGKT